jgi:hypothetical protein
MATNPVFACPPGDYIAGEAFMVAVDLPGDHAME